MRLVLGSVLLSTAPVAALLCAHEAGREAQARWSVMKTAADVLASSAQDAVRLDDPHGAFVALRAVRRTPGVVYARIEDAHGRVLSETGAGARLQSDVTLKADGARPGLMALVATRTLEIHAPVMEADHRIGEVVVVHSAQGLGRELLAALGGVFALAALALTGALMIAQRLQRALTQPLADLSATVAAITQDHDYTRHVVRQSDDEVGRLVTGFNAMLDAIRSRDQRIEAQVKGLEAEVAARTQDYLTARDQALSANAAKSDFLATMSHEIRTPMNGVMVMAELLAAENLPSRARRFADTIARSGRNLLAVINDILDFSKIEAGKLEVETCEVDLPELIDDVIGLFAARAKEKGLELVAHYDRRAPRLAPADPVRLGQVVSNLVSNALKFTESGHVLVQVEPDTKPGFWRLKVSDTGIGIAAEKLKDVFTAFTQEDQTTTRRFGGTGLGLSIAKRLVEAMGGAIAVTSQQGRGSSFHVRLPLVADAPLAAPPNCPKAIQLRLSGPLERSVLEQRLLAAGADLAAETADLILTDHYPGAGGAPVVLIAGADDREAEGLLERGAVAAVLMRPVRLGDVDRLLLRVANDEPLQAESAAISVSADAWPDARVLVVDDAEVNREVAVEALSRFGVRAQIAENGQDALDRMRSEPFDLVLMDGSMPVLDGFAATRQWRAFETDDDRSRTPIIALTAHVVGKAAEAWREADMDGVLHKPFTLDDLGQVLRDWLPADMRRSATQAASADDEPAFVQDDLFDMKTFGALIAGLDKGRGEFVRRVIGLYRQHAPEALDGLRDAHRRADAEGVAAAAHALKSMSFNLGARAVGEVAAGVERAIRLENRRVSADEITLLEVRLEKTMSALDAYLGQPVSMALASADRTEAELMASLAAALDADQLEMWYQPIFDRTGERIVSAEALIRWNRGSLPPIGPGVFMPLAEKRDLALGDDLVCRIGAFARRRVMQDAVAWPDIAVAVNVSANELGQADFTEQVADALAQTGFDASRLVLEVTETAFLGEPERIRALFSELHKLGLSLALDDFGVGYSSLTALHRFSFDKIKIDQEFVVALDGERQSALEALAIIQAVTGIGRVFGMTVVAEGVETQSQHTHLKACGVHQLQGYLFGRPMPAKAFAALLTKAQAA